MNAIEGVSIAKPIKKRNRAGIDEAPEDVKAGRVKKFESVADFFNDLGI